MATRTQTGHYGRVETLDLLRLFAALSVVLYHYAFRGAAADDMTYLSIAALVPVAKYGYLGVQLFFVISGFVIAYSAAGRTTPEFVIARASRIYPGFLACMTVTFLAILAFGAPRYQTSVTQWIANLFVVAPALKQPFMDGAYWSIVYELVFYAWTALLLATGLFARRLTPIVIGWLAISALNETLIGSNALRRLLVTDDSGFFAAGLMLYALYSGRRGVVTWGLLGAATVLGTFQANWSSDWERVHFHETLSYSGIAAISVGAVALVGLALLPKRLPIPKGLVLALGGLTYPLYLLHQELGFIVFNRLEGLAPAPLLAAATAAVMLALAFVIWRFIERPGQKAMKTALRNGLAWWTERRATVRASRPAPTVAMPGDRANGGAPLAVFGPVALPRAAR